MASVIPGLQTPAVPATPDRPTSESLVDRDSHFDGLYRTKQNLKIEGIAEGEIQCEGTLTVVKGARVKAKVTARNVTVGGEMEGEVTCQETCQILPSGQVDATVVARRLIVQEKNFYNDEFNWFDLRVDAPPARHQAAMAAMTPIRRKGGDQRLHMKTAAYREAVRRKLSAYHRHIQLGLIAQGLLQILSANAPESIWRSFGSWIRTIRPGLAPSEQVAAITLRNTLPEFLSDDEDAPVWTKFMRDRIDLERTEGVRLIA